MIRKFLVAVIGMAAFVPGFSQSTSEVKADTTASTTETKPAPEEVKPTTTINGGIDFYWRYDFAKTKANNLTSFTNSHNTFELGMATVKLEHKTAKFDIVVDLGFGKRAQEFAYTDEGILAAIKQAYVSYSPNSWLKLTAGSWATHVGYEVLDAQLNRNYSMSYMFTNGPFSHTGVRADITSGKSGFMIGIANPTDYRYVPAGALNKKAVLAQYSYAASDNFKLYLNFVGAEALDSSKSNQLDLVLLTKLSSKFGIGFNGTYNSTKLREDGKYLSAKPWWGSAVYLNLDPSSWFGLTLRGEYFSDENQLKVYAAQPFGGSVFATTLSANFKVEGFTFIPEFRLDNASKNIFVKSDGSATKSASSFLLSVMYWF